jgi:hypothetical protein
VKIGGCVNMVAARAPLAAGRATFWCMAAARSRGFAHLGRDVCDASAPLEAGWTTAARDIAPVRGHHALRSQQAASSPRPACNMPLYRALFRVFEAYPTSWS